MERACGVCDATMAAVAPKVRAGRDDARPREEVEHDARQRLTSPVFHHPRVHGLRRRQELGRGDPHRPARGGRRGHVRLRRRRRRLLLRLRPYVCVGEPEAECARPTSSCSAAQEAGRARSGRACSRARSTARAGSRSRRPGTAAFKHRMGHGIGLDVHERPFVSEEEETPLEAGMTFTDEPSILVERFGVRIEDVVVCEPKGGRKLNRLPT